ncbi:major facilitator superfamily transporter [Colletotrichum fioriniae PJ7]|uniref:Major facilitator superfamily transporter n=1 Tax=Colletotrichum fioriniae PJ7 TaxID=1445577 RepID=A0A010R8Y4_9PEZI|nr:major facilitator superfamily transporter [Colletotrichum fioriniae PJ7]
MGEIDNKITEERVESASDFPQKPQLDDGSFKANVQLADGDVTYLIPTPSSDPRDYHTHILYNKQRLTFEIVGQIITMTCATFAAVGLVQVSGLGALLGEFIPEYAAEGRGYDDISHLMTYPSLFMGLGNLIGMPLALAVGRRPVFLGSCALAVIGSILCGVQKGYTSHLVARMVLGLAAGQSEALCPLMVQEVHFLHERARCLMWFTLWQSTSSAVYSLLTSYIAAGIGSSGWYFLGSGFAAITFIFAVFMVPETKYDRPLAAYQGQTAQVSHFVTTAGPGVDDTTGVYTEMLTRKTTTEPRQLDFVNFKPRTFASDLRLFTHGADWKEGWQCCTGMALVTFFPDMMWALLLNGLTIGVNIALGTTYGEILQKAPYNWKSSVVSFAMTGQIVVAFLALPLLGRGSDWVIKFFARRNGGVHKAEYRLIPLIIPVIVGTLAAVIYGQAAQHPDRYQWFAIVFALNAYYFGFVGANQVGITYALDAYPTRSGPVLVIICAMRGVISFGTSYGVTPFIASMGYDGAFGIYGALTAGVGAAGIFVFIWGTQIREMVSKWSIANTTTTPSYNH